MTKSTSIYRTEQYPATDIFQNHLDVIQGLMEVYCVENKDYHWGIISDSKYIESEGGSAKKYLNKYEPEKLKYFVKSLRNKSELILYVDNGVSVSVRSGTYELYGLFALLMDACNSMSYPRVLVTLRRYWLLSVFIACLIIPILIILLAGGGWWFLVWLIVGGGVEAWIISYLLETSDWDDFVLSTKIHYDELSRRTIGLLASVFGSVRGIVTLLASIATVITFVIFLLSKH